MAVAQDSFTGNGTKTDYDFTFPYLKQSEIKASLDGTATTNFRHLTATRIQFVNNTTANTPTAPASGVKIKIYRETETSSLAATFYAGSSIKSQDLNDNFTQNLYSNQEVTERYVSNLGGTMTGDLNLGEDVVIKFEGATDNTYETTLTVVDPTADRTITLPNVTGTVVTTGDTGTVATGMIADDAVSADKLANTAVSAGSYTAADITIDAQGRITSASNGSISTNEIGNAAVTTSKIAADNITGALIADDQINSEHYVDGSIDTAHIAADQITSALIADDQINSEHYVDGSIDTQHIADAQITHIKLANDCIDGDNIQDDVVNSEHIAAGALDNEHYAAGSITSDKLNAATVVTNSEQAGITANDTSFFTTSAGDSRYYRLGSVEEIQSGETWTAADNKIATTSAIDARITDLVEEVGGFVPIANETSFPTSNPDINNGAGTLVSIKALASSLTSNGSGVATISNGAGSGNTVTINGLDNSTTYAATLGMIVETTSTLHTYTFHRVTPKATEVTTVATNISNVNSVASNITNINSVNSNASNINSAVSNASNINAAVSNASNINSAVANASNINSAVSNITNINAVGNNSSNINAVAGQIVFSEDLGAITDALTTGTGNNINTCASNLTSINSFAETYRIASSAPSSSLHEGDLWYDSTANVLKYYNGTAWVVTAAAGLSSISQDSSPQLGGHLDCNDKNLTEVGTVSGDNLQIDFGTLS